MTGHQRQGLTQPTGYKPVFVAGLHLNGVQLQNAIAVDTTPAHGWDMDAYRLSEPHPGVFDRIRALPKTMQVCMFAMVRLRQPTTSASAQAALASWAEVHATVAADYGASGTVRSNVKFASAAATGQPWDYVRATCFPSRSEVLGYLSDERLLDAIRERREAIEASPTWLLCHSGLEARSTASAEDWGPTIEDASGFGQHVGDTVTAASALPAGRPFTLITIARLRRDRSGPMVRAAYAGWRTVWNAVSHEHGVTNPLNHNIIANVIGTRDDWHIINAVTYPSREVMAELLADPRILAATAMRKASMEDSQLLLVDPLALPSDA